MLAGIILMVKVHVHVNITVMYKWNINCKTTCTVFIFNDASGNAEQNAQPELMNKTKTLHLQHGFSILASKIV